VKKKGEIGNRVSENEKWWEIGLGVRVRGKARGQKRVEGLALIGLGFRVGIRFGFALIRLGLESRVLDLGFMV
jgi:hypothetical protein